MAEEKVVLCGSSAYEQKYYLNETFSRLPEQVRQEIQIMCVSFTEDVGGVLLLQYNEEGSLEFVTQADEGDLLYDDIGAGLKIEKLRREKKELFEQLELYYRIFALGEGQ